MDVLFYQNGIITDAATAVYAITGTAHTFTMTPNGWYRFVSTVDCHIRQGTTNTGQDATVAASAFVPAKTIIFIRTNTNQLYLSVICNSSSGVGYLTRMAVGV